MRLVHELWIEPTTEELTFCIAANRESSHIPETAELVWSCKADNYVSAMNKLHTYMNWDPYVPSSEEDRKVYKNFLGDR